MSLQTAEVLQCTSNVSLTPGRCPPTTTTTRQNIEMLQSLAISSLAHLTISSSFVSSSVIVNYLCPFELVLRLSSFFFTPAFVQSVEAI